MSMILAVQCWNLRLDKTTKYVLMCLCDSADDDGTRCFPSVGRVAHKTEVHPATVYRVIERLTATGVLTEAGRYGDSIEYHIHLDRVPLKPAYERARRGRPRRNASQAANDLAARETNRSARKVVAAREKNTQAAKKVSQPAKIEPPGRQLQTQAASGAEAAEQCAHPSYTHPITHLDDPSDAREPQWNPDKDADVRAWQKSREGQAYLFRRAVKPDAAFTTVRYMLREWLREGQVSA